MGKNKKTKAAILLKSKSKKKPEAVNPFEIRVNKQHHDILGRKKQKHDRGMPGVARNKANKKREETLLQEYKFGNKSNKFSDRRIGELNPLMTPEEKATARFALQKKKKSSIYNLTDAETEELTHRGRALGDIEKFDHSSDSEDESRLGKEFVQEAHFGGFLTKKHGDPNEAAKSQKDIIDNLIAESKKRKYERQKEKEENMDLTDKLDNDWKELQRVMLSHLKKPNDEPVVDAKDDYDIITRELKFESRGQATDRMKTDEEIAQEERSRLEKLEMERQKRMFGDDGTNISMSNHYSADALDDGFQLSPAESDNDEKSVEESKTKKVYDQKDSDDDEDKDDDDEDKDDEDKDDDDDDKDKNYDGAGSQASEDSDAESEDSFKDVFTSGDEEDTEKSAKVEKSSKIVGPTPSETLKSKTSTNAASDLPYIFECPDSSEDFNQLLHNRTTEEKIIIVERILKSNHPSLANGNKEKLEQFFVILLQYIHDICAEKTSDISLLNLLVPHLLVLVKMSPEATSASLLDVIKEKREEFVESPKKYFPDFGTVIFFQLVSLFYSTSDFHHPLITPTLIFMSEVLARGSIRNMDDIFKGVFVCNIFLNCVSISKRIVPEALKYLTSTLSSELKAKDALKLETPAKPVKLNLAWLRDVFKVDVNLLVIGLISSLVDLLSEFADLYRESSSYKELFAPTLNVLNLKPKESNWLVDKIDDLENKLRDLPLRQKLALEKKRPVGIKMYEPKFEESFDGRKKRQGSQKKLEQQKLLYKYKREMKGAMREIRLDNQFIGRQKLKDQMERDSERKRKLNQLYQDLASQEGDFKKMKKKK